MEQNIKLEEPIQTPNNALPLFIKKLWKIVNDADAEHIISWNEQGDGFIIHDQFQFITKLLPHYFKHNNMSSFVRQLNFYNFHKVANLEGQVEFAHTYFIQDMPEILSFIRRKNPVIKPKTTSNVNEDEVHDILGNIKNLKSKHVLVDRELSKLKQENLALWTELNSLRVKYTKQSTIINTLIHFLMTYIHSHQTAFSKNNIPNQHSGNNINIGPPLLEIGYKQKKSLKKNQYTIIQPEESSPVTYSFDLSEKCSPDIKKARTSTQDIDKIFSMKDQVELPNMNRSKKSQRSGITYSFKLRSEPEELNQSEIQRSLLEILKKNEELCEEEQDDMLAKLISDEEDLVDVQEDLQHTNGDTPVLDGYTVIFPTENTQELSSETQLQSQLNEFDVESSQDNIDVSKVDSTVTNSNMCVKEVPIITPSGVTKYTVSYPKIQNSKHKLNSSKVNVVDHIIIPKKKKTPLKPLSKSAKIPVVKKDKQFSKKANAAGILASKKSASPLVNILPTQSNNTTNVEGTLLEILKENEELSNESLGEQIPQNNVNISQSNLDKLTDDVEIGEAFEHYYPKDIGGVNLMQSNVKTKPQSFPEHQVEKVVAGEPASSKEDANDHLNILENPKVNLGTYVDSTQEEIDLLQNILNNLTSNGFSELISTETPDLSVDDISAIDDEVRTDDFDNLPAVNMDESVDKYFEKHFLDPSKN